MMTNTEGQQPMMFKVVCLAPELSHIGYEWIEVLSFLPFRVREPEDVCDHLKGKVWDYESWAMVRTPAGIHRLGMEELMEEIEMDIYIEEGSSEERIAQAHKQIEAWRKRVDEEALIADDDVVTAENDDDTIDTVDDKLGALETAIDIIEVIEADTKSRSLAREDGALTTDVLKRLHTAIHSGAIQ